MVLFENMDLAKSRVRPTLGFLRCMDQQVIFWLPPKDIWLSFDLAFYFGGRGLVSQARDFPSIHT